MQRQYHLAEFVAANFTENKVTILRYFITLKTTNTGFEECLTYTVDLLVVTHQCLLSTSNQKIYISRIKCILRQFLYFCANIKAIKPDSSFPQKFNGGGKEHLLKGKAQYG
jgi:hypothetical protein